VIGEPVPVRACDGASAALVWAAAGREQFMGVLFAGEEIDLAGDRAGR
jgi:hypothetical protein